MGYHFAIAIACVLGLVGLWTAVQALERVVKRLPRGSDVLACWMCSERGGCRCALREKRGGDERT